MNKSNYNLNIIEPLLGTQYGDYGGYIQIDGHSGADLQRLCYDNGIDEKKYFVIGFGCGESSGEGVGKRNSIYCSAIVLETSKYGSTFDEVQKYIATAGGKVKAKRVHFSIDPKMFSKYIKRFDFMVAMKITSHIFDIEVKDIY